MGQSAVGREGHPCPRTTASNRAHHDYAEMTGIKPSYIKPADLAWYCSHHHNVVGENVSYSYSYLFAYAIDLPAGTKTMTLPDNEVSARSLSR